MVGLLDVPGRGFAPLSLSFFVLLLRTFSCPRVVERYVSAGDVVLALGVLNLLSVLFFSVQGLTNEHFTRSQKPFLSSFRIHSSSFFIGKTWSDSDAMPTPARYAVDTFHRTLHDPPLLGIVMLLQFGPHLAQGKVLCVRSPDVVNDTGLLEI